MTRAPQVLDVNRSRGYCLGIDLGTTFVAAALCESAKPEMLTLGTRSVAVPAAVYLDEDGTLLCGEAAVHRSVSDPGRAARGFKRRLGDPTPVRMGGESRSSTELLAALLREVLRVATETEGAPPDRVMLTRPANWGPFRCEVFAEVARLAGLDEVDTVTEPEAAAVHYARSHKLADGRLVAVYDLGGGTFDVTVLHAGQARVELLGVPEGIERLGGLDFDDALFAHLDHVCDGALTALDTHDPQVAVTLARLGQDLVLAKEHLSVDAHATIPVFLPDRNFELRITRAVFEDLVRAHIESTIGALERTLRSARLAAADLDAVLLVGGSSRIPLVAEMLAEALGRPVVVDTHPKYAVALGASALATQASAAVPRVTRGTPPDPVGDRRPNTRVAARFAVAGLAVMGIASAGFLSRSAVPENPGLVAAAPLATCASDCSGNQHDGLPAGASDPISRCAAFSDMPPGCESGRPAELPLSGTRDNASTKSLPTRPRVVSPGPPPTALVKNSGESAAPGTKSVNDRTNTDKKDIEKTGVEKAGDKASAERKKSKGRKDSSQDSSALGLLPD